MANDNHLTHRYMLFMQHFIVHSYMSNDHTDYNTWIPILEKHEEAFGKILEAVTADSGYCSGKNQEYNVFLENELLIIDHIDKENITLFHCKKW